MNKKSLVLDRLFDPLWLARIERKQALERTDRAKQALNTQEFNRAAKEARKATAEVVRLELGR
jgi:hypothetical protein